MSGRRLRNFGVVAGAAAALTIATTSVAWANWSKSPFGLVQGTTSQQWVDEQYNEFHFTGCDQAGTTNSVDVALWQQIDWGSDVKHDTSTLTNCFKGSGYTSTATQSGLPYDSYYLEITKLGTGCAACTGAADKVSVDTTLAD
ncbi:hypothetical protein [Streptomyces bicolor]|uniref:hypothetical protein n=1 Tax=Streptomyces bicolor TaxID=66874 RepID=UPI0004E0D752|nr:hypothetical protein [Streptomyces bicolor]